MSEEQPPKTEVHEGGVKGFLISFFRAVARDLVNLVLAFGIGTGAGAIACWYYNLPMILSLLGGILVLGLALALTTDSLFS